MLKGLVLGILLLPLPLRNAGASPAAPAAGVSGAFYQEGKQPIPGALVVLYESGTGYLIDSTYTREDGKFDLRPPLRKGSYRLVATKGNIAEPVALAYDPAAPGIYREIVHKTKKSFWARATEFLISQTRGFFLTIVAFFWGYFTKQWEGRMNAINNLEHRSAELRNLVEEANRELGEALKGLQRPIQTPQYRKILADMLARVVAIETELAKAQDVAVGLRYNERYIGYRRQVEKIKRIASSQDSVGFGQASDRLSELESLLGDLESRSLMPKRSRWWRRTRSTS